MIIVASASIVEQDGKFLLVQEGRKEFSGKWNLPCGEIDSGESIIICAAREGKEETGYELEIHAFMGTYQQLKWSNFGGRDLIVMVFHSKIVGGEKTVPSHLLDVGWFSFGEISQMAMDGKLVHNYVFDSIREYTERKHKAMIAYNIPIDSKYLNFLKIYPSDLKNS